MRLINNIKLELCLIALIFIYICFTLKFDYLFNNFISEIINLDTYQNLKIFFVNITRLGSSFWYFSIALFFIIIFFINNIFKIIKLKNLEVIKRFFVSFFLYLLIVGIATQLIKHIVGRPRPNYTNYDEAVSLNFFTFDSNLHSFPSGHSSTIFIVCFILSSVLPKLKYYFYFLATVVALSRVVVGAHFLTDVVSGGILALIIFKTLNLILNEYNKKLLFSEINFKHHGALVYFVIFLIGLCVFVTVGPQIDLYIASLFYLGKFGFYLQSFHALSIFFRDVFLPMILFYILVLPIVSLFLKIEKVFFGHKFNFREIILIWSSQIIVILIFINLGLKNFWGRARPDEIMEFGGDFIFSPWYKITNACDYNCSFVSGDASVGFSIIILYLVTKNLFYLYGSIFCGLSLGLIRIFAGGHFFSDIIFSGLFTIVLSLVVFQIYKHIYVK